MQGRAKLAHHYVSGKSIVHIVQGDEDLPTDSMSSHKQQPVVAPFVVGSPNRRSDSPLSSTVAASASVAAAAYGISPAAAAAPFLDRIDRKERTTSATLRSDAADEPDKLRVWAWGSTGEERWNPDVEISTDWKSLVRLGGTREDRIRLITRSLYFQISPAPNHDRLLCRWKESGKGLLLRRLYSVCRCGTEEQCEFDGFR